MLDNASGLLPKYIFVTEKAFSAPLGNRLEATLSPINQLVHFVSDSVLNNLSDTVTSQGVVAAFQSLDYVYPKNSTLLVVCDGIADPGNLGTILRTSYGFGADAVITVGGCDPWVSAEQ